MAAGADCIDDAHVLRSGSSAKVLAHKVMAPSALGTFLHAFSFGQVCQLDKVAEAMLAGECSLGAGPGAEPMTPTSTRRSVRSMSTTSKAPLSATPRCSATTHCSERALGLARSSMSGSERDRLDRDEEQSDSSESSSDLCDEQGQPVLSRFRGSLGLPLPPCHKGLSGPQGLLVDHR
jgi:hypothetical protein